MYVLLSVPASLESELNDKFTQLEFGECDWNTGTKKAYKKK